MTHPDSEGLRKALEDLPLVLAGLMPHGPYSGAEQDTFHDGWRTCVVNLEVRLKALLSSPPAPCEGCGKKDEAMAVVLEGLRGFRACMEAQRTDAALPPGHDEPDESCGDGVCYQSGATIDRDIATLEAALSPAPAKPDGDYAAWAKERGLTGKMKPLQSAPAKPCAPALTEEEREALAHSKHWPEDVRLAVLASLVRRLLGQGETR
jgi:hypothetical protein